MEKSQRLTKSLGARLEVRLPALTAQSANPFKYTAHGHKLNFFAFGMGNKKLHSSVPLVLNPFKKSKFVTGKSIFMLCQAGI